MEEGSSSGKDSITNDRRHTTAVIDVTLGWPGGSLLSSTNTNAEKNTFTTHKHTNTNTNTNCLTEISDVPSEARMMRQNL